MEILNSFLKWLAEHYPLLFLGIAILVLVIWITVKCVKYHSRFSDVEGECEKIIIIEKSIGNITASVERIELQSSKITAIEKNIHALVTFLSTKYTDLQSGLFTSRSPLQLTEMGVKILEAIGGKKYVDENLDYLISVMEKEDFASGLDVQNFTNVLLLKEYDSERFLPVKNYIFQNPFYRNDNAQISLDLNTVNQIIGIYLRDKYFSKHPELNIEK